MINSLAKASGSMLPLVPSSRVRDADANIKPLRGLARLSPSRGGADIANADSRTSGLTRGHETLANREGLPARPH